MKIEKRKFFPFTLKKPQACWREMKIKAGNFKSDPHMQRNILLNFHNFEIYFCGENFFYSSNIHAFSKYSFNTIDQEG